MKSHGNEAIDFSDKKVTNVDSNHTSLAVISLDFALKEDGNYHPEVFLKKSNYIEKKVVTHTNENLSDSFVMMMSLMKNKLKWVKFSCKSTAT